MKKVLTVIAVLAVVAGFSSTAYAKGTNGWDFLNTFFTGKGLKQNCTTINAGDPLKTAVQIGAMQGADVSIGTDNSSATH